MWQNGEASASDLIRNVKLDPALEEWAGFEKVEEKRKDIL